MAMPAATRPPIALTIAGSDSSGGAGIQADLKTFTALGIYGASVLTALTAQNTTGVSAVHTPPADFVRAQIKAVFDDLKVGAAKTGMLANAAIIEAVADELEKHPGVPLVVDPVMVATSGDRLLDTAAVDVLIKRLLPRATLLTPNLPEAAALLGLPEATDIETAEAQAQALVASGCRAVLVKGGHFEDSAAVDVLAIAGEPPVHISAPRIATSNTHGTGCTLSAAIAALLADGLSLKDAVRGGKTYLSQAIANGAELNIGQGNGPVDHLFAIKRQPRPV
ncbi:MAG: bifunctional hydroxymethylpyrimidine kinase/phosphomethylpyrimidine kinase [Hyphomicrobiaceae bacterium]